MARCGDKPRLLAIGVAPLGIVSIGIVPMGVVSIGVVPMGVVSLGVVGMGVLNACVVGMGVLVAAVHGMGIWSVGVDGQGLRRIGVAGHASMPHHSTAAPPPKSMLSGYPSRQQALDKARELGCEGVHAMGSLWMPCASHPPGSAEP
ncbi:MAG: hypothetical protein VKO39_08065 [Cyanobacteriota bacterium]|nr:hypothetical protein [Cyanobacteriota bacterium]